MIDDDQITLTFERIGVGFDRVVAVGGLLLMLVFVIPLSPILLVLWLLGWEKKQ